MLRRNTDETVPSPQFAGSPLRRCKAGHMV